MAGLHEVSTFVACMGLTALYLHHDRKQSNLSRKLFCVPIIYSIFEGSRELASVGNMPLPAFGREDLSFRGELIPRWQKRFLKMYTLISDRKLISRFERGAIIAIEENSCPYVS